MAHRRGSALFVAPLLALSLFLAGCPKRPATMAASAPAPGVATPPPAPAPPVRATAGSRGARVDAPRARGATRHTDADDTAARDARCPGAAAAQ